MGIDLDGWEKKALLIVAVLVFILVAYAYNPFQSTNVTSSNETYTPPTTSAPVSQTPVVSNNSNNSTNSSGNNPFLISATQAKNIALSQNPGYTASDPMQGTIVVNQTTVAVWIVPLSKFAQSSKTVYVDVNTGKIVNVT